MKKKYILKGLDCANCANKMEKAIGELDGVKECTVNFLTAKLIIDGEEDKMPEIIEHAQKIIKKLEPQVQMIKA